MTKASPAFRRARSCYSHLAGEAGVTVRQRLEAMGYLQQEGDAYRLTDSGRKWAAAHGLDTDDRHPERHARCCLDGTEKQLHLGGRLGASMLAHLLDKGTLKRGEGRVLHGPDASGFGALFAALDLI